MPQLIPEYIGFPASYSPRCPIEQRPQHAAGIGLVAAEWAALEDELVHVFQFSIFSMTDERHGGVVAKTALENIDSISARLDVIEALLKSRVSAERFRHWIDTLKPEICRRARERNRVVHAAWQISEAFPDDVIVFMPDGSKYRYGVQDFHDIASRIIATSSNIATYLFTVTRLAGTSQGQ